MLIMEELERPPSARRFVTLRASANNVVRKLEVQLIQTIQNIQKIMTL
ncbi:MAG: hypothetical protein IKX30_09365 [Victivallales bacterium]|nr:hypothetical protein [Victivallales bacterium]